MAIFIDSELTRERITEDWFLDILLTQTGKSEMKKCLLDMIDSIPLAYDVEKVVEQLEEEKYINKPQYVNAPYQMFNDGILDRAISIVKEGGKDE